MRIRAIRLENVRRFAEPVSVGPVGDGVTLLCEPNEAGKSTLFDALHALFFAAHRSFAKDVQGLQPRSGGKVSVECDLEIEGTVWRVRKRWQKGAGGEAKAWRDGVLTHQGDAVEDWLSDLVASEKGGPGGLLWVRQGRVKLAAEKDPKDAELGERRDLLTALSGALDDVTGGERMDRARASVEEELGRLITTTGKPKANGPLAAAEAELDRATAERTALRGQVDAFRDELREMRRIRDELAGLELPDEVADRDRAVAEAAEAVERAERHSDRIDAAADRARLARRERDAAIEARERRQAVTAEAAEAAREAVRAGEAAEARTARLATAEKAALVSEAGLKAARDALRRAEEMQRAARRRIEAEAARGQRVRLARRLEEAEAAERARAEAAGRVARGPDVKVVARIEALLRDRDAQRASRDAAAPSVTFLPEPGAEATIDGAALPSGEAVPLPQGGEIVLPGAGRLRIAVPAGQGDAVERSEAALSDALSRAGWADIEAVRMAALARDEAQRVAAAQAAARDAVAPDGIAALREALAALPEPEAEAGEVPSVDEADASVEAARVEAEAAEADVASGRARREDARVRSAEAASDLRAAAHRDAAARAALEALPELETAPLEALQADAARAEAALAELSADAPNLEVSRARLERLTRVRDTARAQTVTLRERRAALGARLETRADEGVEERLVEAEEREAQAEATLERLVFERDVLLRLRTALEEARSEARDAYFAPVARELGPLLGELWDDAELVWSDDTLLPVALTRRGEAEPVDILSGGTQEQLAFLVRLAFARLLARSGRHAPLILDDALVYSDDDRIEKMFDALHGAAGDLQIIVLSCRQKVFRELGAPQLSFEPIGRDGA